MSEEEYLPPVVLEREKNAIRITCDHNTALFRPDEGDPPGASDVSSRIFHALMNDLRWRMQAE